MKLVVDTNTLISGTLWPGKPARLLNAALSVPGTLCLSHEIIVELSDVLARPKFAVRLNAQDVTVSDVLARIQRLSRKVIPAEITYPPNLRDPKDFMILEAAAGAEADAIVTGDKDLLAMKRFRDIPIITAAEALTRLGMEWFIFNDSQGHGGLRVSRSCAGETIEIKFSDCSQVLAPKCRKHI